MSMIKVGGVEKPVVSEVFEVDAYDVQVLYCGRARVLVACEYDCALCIYARENINAFRNHYKWNR